MAVAKVVQSQRDFSAGELDAAVKRNDENPLLKKGARQMSNFRILNSGGIKNRPGRRVLFFEVGRVEEVLLSPGNKFYLVFGNGYVRIYNAAGALQAEWFKKGDGTTAIPWTTATLQSIAWTQIGLSLYITYSDDAPLNVPLIINWDGATTWTLTNFAEAVTAGGQKRTLFYRLSPKGVTMLPSAQTGNITLTFSSAILVAGHVGTRMRFVGRQVLITSLVSSSVANATVIEPLPGAENIGFATDPRLVFNIGDEVVGATSGARGIVTGTGPGSIGVQLSTSGTQVIQSDAKFGQATITAFSLNEVIVGPGGSLASNSLSGVIAASVGISVWDDEVMNNFRGWPAFCFADQSRLGFCNFSPMPRGIAWSELGLPNDLYVDAQPTNAIFELVPDNVQVLYVIPGPESSEFVFCDRRVYYIPISATNPLRPGSVAFQILSSDGCAAVHPRPVQEIMVYINAGGTSVMSIVAPGAYYRPYETRNLTELHAHLLNAPLAIAAPTGDGTFNERYIYVLNADGTLAVGKYTIEAGQIKGSVGWLPWSGGVVHWVAALSGSVVFTTRYSPPGDSVSVVEALDDTFYLDGAQMVNVPPTALIPPGGKGPFWWIPNGTIDLMDKSTRMMGTYRVDANGFLIPQNIAGEDLTSLTLVGGQAWTATYEPFVPPVQPGQDVRQRMSKRRILRHQVYVQNSSGFVMARLFGGPVTRTSPAVGTIMKQRRFPAWNVDDDATLAPPLREQSYLDRPLGRNHDPRVAVIKDTPGPLIILEDSLEVTV